MAYNQQYNIIDEYALIVIYEEEKRERSEGLLPGERPLRAIPAFGSTIPLIKDRFEPDLDNSEKLFSFGQNYNSIEQNEKMIQEKANFLNRIRSLEEELKSCKSKASLWEKCKA